MAPRTRRFLTWEAVILVMAWGVSVVVASIATGNVFVGMLIVMRALEVPLGVLLILACLLAIVFPRRRN